MEGSDQNVPMQIWPKHIHSLYLHVNQNSGDDDDDVKWVHFDPRKVICLNLHGYILIWVHLLPYMRVWVVV